MADVRLLVQEEGRAARNLIAFNVPIDNEFIDKNLHKTSNRPKILQANTNKRCIKSTARIRSASTGRDKRSELKDRYWAFLFGYLQRAVDSIYQTCEEDENISECKEVILVLENYTRDFHNLIEWFKVKWAYETSAPPQRRTSLSWEIRKTSPCRVWGSSSKPGSPRPASRSPVEETIGEIDFIADLDTSQNKEIISSKSLKTLIDCKSQNSFIDNSKNLKEKLPNTGTIKLQNKSLKRPVSAKGIVETEVKVLTEKNIKAEIDSKNSRNIKQNNIFRQSATANKENNIENSTVSKRNDATLKKDLETTKNLLNMNAKTKYETEKKDSKLSTNLDNKITNKSTNITNVSKYSKINSTKPAYATVSSNSVTQNQTLQKLPESTKLVRSKTTLGIKEPFTFNKAKSGSSVVIRKQMQPQIPLQTPNRQSSKTNDVNICSSVEVLTRHTKQPPKVDVDGWQTVRSRYRRGSTHNLNMSTRFNKPSTAISLPALCTESPAEKNKKNCFTPDGNLRQKRRSIGSKIGKNELNKVDKSKGDFQIQQPNDKENINDSDSKMSEVSNNTNSTSMIAAIFKNEAELLEKRIQQFVAAQAERERIILEEERKTEEADTQRSKQLSEEEASLQKQILELESSEIDVDTETDETDVELVLEIEEEMTNSIESEVDEMSLEDRYENILEGMSWAERMDTLAQLKAIVARHPGRALELHQKLSSPSRKRSLPETLRKFQAKQACAQHKRQKLLMEKSQRLRELLNKVEDVKIAKNQLIEDKKLRMELKLKRAEENRTQHLLEVVRKAHDEDSKLKEIAFINELEAQNKRHDFMALCQEQEERLQGIQEERQRRQEEKAAKEVAAEERRRALEAERQLRIQKMRQVRREREERVGKMQLEREKERQELAREKARDREERLSALHAAQLANQEELQKKIAQKQQESARRHVENIEHIRQRAVESSIMRSEEVPPTLKSYITVKQCILCNKIISNEVLLISHLRGKIHSEAVKKMHDSREPSRDELQKFNISQIKDIQLSNNNQNEMKVAKEKQKALKRRSRKIKQRISVRSQEYEDSLKNSNIIKNIDSANKNKFRKNLKELHKLCQSQTKSICTVANLTTLERCLGDIARSFSKSCPLDQDSFSQLGGFETLSSLLSFNINVQNNLNLLPNKNIVSIFRVYLSAVNGHKNNIESILLSNKIMVILDMLIQRLESLASLDYNSQAQEMTSNVMGNGSVAVAATQLLCALVPDIPFDNVTLQSRIQDIVGYLVTSGLLERIQRHTNALIESDFLTDQENESPLLLTLYDLLSRLCIQLKRSKMTASNNDSNSLASGETEHNTSLNLNLESSTAKSHLLSLLITTEAAGAVGVLYAAVALSSSSQKAASPISPTPVQNVPNSAAKNLALAGLKLLKSIAELDLSTLQTLLGQEGTSLQWRFIASYLIGRLSRETAEKEVNNAVNTNNLLLSELFTVLGYFSVNNSDNQLVLQSAGTGPSVLQQLCTLPFPYYGDPKLSSYTLPSLLAATHNNSEAIAILSCEMSYQLLEEYRDSERGKFNPLVNLLKT